MGTVRGVYTAFTLWKVDFLSLRSTRGFLEGVSSLISLRFSPLVSFLAACASSMLMYFAALARRASNLATGFLARDLKKSPSKSPCEKALAFTSCVAAGTSNAAALNLCKYSFNGSSSFWRTAKRLSSVFHNFLLLANWCRKRERNS
ncbi:UNVERIFIED_CONTAM: hypothetical protein Slati_2702800 [Sesamum latifolium]|uniref:Uncharacterized protein n=1 Tax=Sesamum latifolium TaxID=2727402 RepID=A0AAW2VXS2_9LAMI